MKKTYRKPQVFMESFQLDAAIAASCSGQGFIPIGAGESNCGYGIGEGGYAYFNAGNCDEDVVSTEGGNDSICYHGPWITGGATFTYS